MTRFQWYNKNFDVVKDAIRIGDYSTCIINRLVIYSRYDYYLKTGMSKSTAVICTAEDKKVSEDTVWKIKKKMEECV
jgi:hypothetical protein